ncbi:MAG TPA: monomeric sarcosine oxidase, partial [Gammaproteobacteria bacterium]|nr:monomeric sarcosine oxidase [Gammaproteobacteria bacterium]
TGYSNNTRAMYGLAGKAEGEGVRILTGATVKEFARGNGSPAITAVVTDRGTVECDYLVIAAGPWVKSLWEMLELPRAVSIKGLDG